MSNPKCGVTFDRNIDIDDINNLVVKFNGNPVAATSTHVSGNTYSVTVPGTATENKSGEVKYYDGETLILTVAVECP